MKIIHLNIRNLRIIEEAEISPSSHINLIIGTNGSGKTTLLEAIYLLARAKSFRTNKASPLLRYGQQNLLISARLENKQNSSSTIGITKTNKETEIKVSGKRQSKLSELAKQLPLVIVTPDVNRIIEEGPEIRRRLLNWGVFHVEQNYSKEVLRYNRVLGQRNSSLKQYDGNSSYWDRILSSIGETLSEKRQNYIKAWESLIKKNSKPYAFLDGLSIKLKQGWPENSTYIDALTTRLESDKSQGFTTLGPHRADLKITLNGVQARDCLSRGQIKILSTILLFSQADLIQNILGDEPILLIDDIQAELDRSTKEQFLTDIYKRSFQTFITSTDYDMFTGLNLDARMFHVEHGQISVADH